MSTFAEKAQNPNSTKIILCEIDIGFDQEFWVNKRAGTWQVNFDVVYPEIASWFLQGVESRSVTRIGSITMDGIILTEVGSVSDVQLYEYSFYWDQNAHDLYVHLVNGDKPLLHRLTLGESFAVSNYAGPLNNWSVYNDYIYEPRLKSIPSVATRKDPVFFGKIAFEGGTITLDNADGFFNTFGEDNDVFGGAVRLLIGFDDLPYSQFRKIFTGFIENLTVTQMELRLDVQNKRKALSRRLPAKLFTLDDYPYLKPKNNGKPVPLLYGVCKKVPVTCTNEKETPAPQYFNFKICDTTFHSIYAIDKAYDKDDEEVTIASGSKNLATAVFQLETGNLTYSGLAGTFQEGERIKGSNTDASTTIARDTGSTIVFEKRPKDRFDVGETITGADSGATATIATYEEGQYYPGDDISVDVQGYVFTGTSMLIHNALDVILDLLSSYYPIYFNSNYFDTYNWPTARAPDIGYFVEKPKELIDIIEEISSSIFGWFPVKDDGRYAYKIYNQYAVSKQTITEEEILNLTELEIGYDSTEVLTSARIGYAKDWKNAEYLIHQDDSHEDEVFKKFRIYREKTFDTLLTGQSAAEDFADTLFLFSSDVLKPFSITTKMQTVEREVGDFIDVEIDRVAKKMLGLVKAEILGIEKDGNNNLVRLACRIVSIYPETVYQQGFHYGDTYYGHRYYGTTLEREIA